MITLVPSINSHVEKSKFEFAGKVLAEIWNIMTFNGHTAHIKPSEPELPDDPEINDFQTHPESQYLLQFIKHKVQCAVCHQEVVGLCFEYSRQSPKHQ